LGDHADIAGAVEAVHYEVGDASAARAMQRRLRKSASNSSMPGDRRHDHESVKNGVAELQQDDADRQNPTSAWEPLRHPVFRGLWIAALVSTPELMQNVAAAWYMTSLSSSPLMVALIQGPPASRVPSRAPRRGGRRHPDRRRLLLFTQG
jgi:hypothetical protein